jgi:predicted aspartyl protease
MSKHAFNIKIRRDVDALAHVRVAITNPETGMAADFNAIIDTGANYLSISERVVDKLHLGSLGGVLTSSAAGKTLRDEYEASLTIPAGENGIVFTNLRAIDFDSTPTIDVLIGMNVLRSGDLAMTKDSAGNTLLSFRQPHGPCVDYTT